MSFVSGVRWGWIKMFNPDPFTIEHVCNEVDDIYLCEFGQRKWNVKDFKTIVNHAPKCVVCMEALETALAKLKEDMPNEAS